jgi:hypothetical protein
MLKPILRLALAVPLLLLALASAAVEAQEPVQSSSPTLAHQDDSLTAAGRRDGSASANNHGVRGRFALAFVGGLPLGFVGPLAVASHYSAPKLAAGAGIGVIGAAAVAGEAGPPQSLIDSVGMHGSHYEQAFRRAYSDRLRDRRKRSAFWGGLAGTATGLGAFILIASLAYSGT